MKKLVNVIMLSALISSPALANNHIDEIKLIGFSSILSCYTILELTEKERMIKKLDPIQKWLDSTDIVTKEKMYKAQGSIEGRISETARNENKSISETASRIFIEEKCTALLASSITTMP